ncbi:hypothetical protein P879_00978 [Paragonimus westermani]|uniref:Uncharacterized protein n=1 Tax=Paragonimus westermani TaxID=34504 RepID=A0A8T0DMV0_9TREM|nr:hypothetical protein P879_00978 [Paragonimus westermani]
MKLISTGSQNPMPNEHNTISSQSSKELKMSANAAKKARIHGQRVISMAYCIVVLAISIGITLYSTGHRVAEIEPSFVWFFNTLYLTSVTGMVCVLGYIYKNRRGSIEAIEKGSSTAPRILFSLQGEPVSLYLRIGLCIFTVMAIAHTVCRAVEISLTSKDFHWVIPFASSKILFFIVQTIFILLLHRLVVLARKRLFSLVLLHLITVNLCFWVDSAIEKISQSVTMEHSNVNHTIVTNRYRLKATSYFLPAIPEYCAISVAVIFEMSQRIGQFRQIEDGHQVKHNDVLFKVSGKYFEESRLQALHMFITVILPMVMLFRYHSSVCLAIAFVRIYEDEVTRYESILRWVKEGTTKELLQKRISLLSSSECEITPLVAPPALKQLSCNEASPPSDLWIVAPSSSTLTIAESTCVNNSLELEDLPRTMPKVRRDTRTIWELARNNISARESFHQLTKMKLIRQQQKKVSNSSDEKKNASNELKTLEETLEENCSMKFANKLTPPLQHTK